MSSTSTFDETLPGPWEWDVKRLAASMLIGAQNNGYRVKDQERIVLSTVESYRSAMRDFAGMTNLDVWYAHADIEGVIKDFGSQLKGKMSKRTEKTLAKARTRDSMSAFSKLTHVVDGQVRDRRPITADRPHPGSRRHGSARQDLWRAEGAAARYRETLEFDRRVLAEEFELVDMARKVVGVGSVGTRAWIALLLGRDEHDPLFLQIKEAEASVFEPFLGPSQFANHGERVVVGQRLMQASSDILLGWLHIKSGLDGQARDFYVRQLRDWKGSAEVDQMVPKGMAAVRPAVRVDSGSRPRAQRGPRSRSPPTSGAARASTARSSTSLPPMPNRINVTSKRSPRR